jgi:hypothetical protein
VPGSDTTTRSEEIFDLYPRRPVMSRAMIVFMISDVPP